jgi:uncharacterized protein YecE (DUF72 family)
MTTLHIGTAGWSIPAAVADQFPPAGVGLARYAARFNAAEINTSFYRSHRPQTYERWTQTTPPGFRFAVKTPRTITHDARLVDCEPLLEAFLGEVRWLGDKLGPVLIQLPPSLAFDAAVCERFFGKLRDRFDGQVVCEPRHPTWFDAPADRLLQSRRIARVAADPACCPAAAEPGGWSGLAYWRWHGSPRMYYSAYGEAELRNLAKQVASHPASEAWCVFDNTALGAAAADALRLQALTATD